MRLNLTGEVPDAPITVYWNVTEGADGMANIAISNPNTDSGECGASMRASCHLKCPSYIMTEMLGYMDVKLIHIMTDTVCLDVWT